MAERTLAEIESEAGRPSMVAGTEEEAYVQFIDVRGPFKVETRYYQQAAANDFKANDTFTTRIAHPLFATISSAQDIDGTALAASVDLTSDESNSNFKQVTLRDAEGVNGLGVVVQVFGF